MGRLRQSWKKNQNEIQFREGFLWQPRDTKFTGKILKVTVDVKARGEGEKVAAGRANTEAARKIEEAK